MKPLVTALIPLFDGERFIGQALDSVLTQDYAPIELLVVDDGSTDSGPEIARSRGARVMRHEGKGVAAARNAGVAASRGEIIAFLDQDDLWLPAKTSLQVDALESSPEAVCFTRHRFFVEEGAAIPAWFGKPELVDQEHDGYSPSGMAIRRPVFDRVGWFEESMTQAGDLDWLARARHLGLPFHVVPELLVLRRVHGENESGNPRTVQEMLLAMRRAAARNRGSRQNE